MESIKIISDGTSNGTRIITSGGHEIGGVVDINIDKIEHLNVVSATVKFAGVCLGDVESAFSEPCGEVETDIGGDTLQDAITSTEVACSTASGETLVALQEHLIRLLNLQYSRLTGLKG